MWHPQIIIGILVLVLSTSSLRGGFCRIVLIPNGSQQSRKIGRGSVGCVYELTG